MNSRSTALAAALLALLVGTLSGPASAQYFGGITLNPPRASVFESETLVPLAGIYTLPSMLDAGRRHYGLRLDLRTSPLFAGDSRNWSLNPNVIGPRAQATDIGFSGALPLSERFTLTSRLAAINMKPDVAPGLSFLSPYGYRTNRMSLGVQYDVSRSMGLRFELARQHYLQGTSFDGETDRNFSFNLSFRF